MCPLEFRLDYGALKFLRQELREEHSRFTLRRCLVPQLSGVGSAPANLHFRLRFRLRYRETL